MIMTRAMQVSSREAHRLPTIGALSPGMTNGTIWLWKAKSSATYRGDFVNDAHDVLAAITGSTASDDTATAQSIEAPNVLGVTPKGGNYVLWSRSSPATANQSMYLASNAVRDYMQANRGHAFFLGWFGRQLDVSPNPSTAPNSARLLGVINSASAPVAAILRGTDNVIGGKPEATRTAVRQSVSAAGTGWKNVYAAFTDLSAGTPGSSNAVMLHHNGGAGSPSPSYVSYMSMIIDLTVADITDQEAEALWVDMVNRFAPRWADDTLPELPA